MIAKTTALLLAGALALAACSDSGDATPDEPEAITTVVEDEIEVQDSGPDGEAESEETTEGDEDPETDTDSIDESSPEEPEDDQGAPITSTVPDPADGTESPLLLSVEDLGEGWELYFSDVSELDPNDTTFPDCDTNPPAEPLAGDIAFFQNEGIGNFTQFVFQSDADTIVEWLDVIERTVDCGDVTENGIPSRYTDEAFSFDSGADEVVSVRAVELDANGGPASGALLMFARYGDTLFIGVTTFGATVDLDADWIAERHRMAAEKADLL